jgi:hypothetical protein
MTARSRARASRRRRRATTAATLLLLGAAVLAAVVLVAAAADDAPPSVRPRVPRPRPINTRLLRGRSAAVAFSAALLEQQQGGGAAAAAAAAASSAASSAATRAAALPAAVRERSTFWSRELLRDDDLYYAPSVAKLVYACSGIEMPSAPAAAVAAADDPAPGDASADAAPAGASGIAHPSESDPLAEDAFRLHSRPASARKIVLDFTGHVLRAGTAWGGVRKGGDLPIVTPAYDLDNDNATFSAAERASIVAVWRQVAEDFSAWDVDVTTEEPPGTDDEGDAALKGNGTRVAIGKNSGWFDNAGGVAFINGFGEAWSGPVAHVFNTFAPSVAVAVSHELGHTFGLAHHGDACAAAGTLESAYYPGHGAWGASSFCVCRDRTAAGGRRC